MALDNLWQSCLSLPTRSSVIDDSFFPLILSSLINRQCVGTPLHCCSGSVTRAGLPKLICLPIIPFLLWAEYSDPPNVINELIIKRAE